MPVDPTVVATPFYFGSMEVERRYLRRRAAVEGPSPADYERADTTSNTYYDWIFHNDYFIFAAQAAAAKFVETFNEFPPVQRPGSFTIDQAMSKMADANAGAS